MKKYVLSVLSILLLLPSVAFADSQPGDMIITLGKNLTDQQKSQLLLEMKATEDALFVEVTNEEEHQYLGNYISKAQIGTRALSSASITVGEKDSGLTVTTNNINWVTNEMYVNALITAGVKDANIYITSPIAGVSGTAALTGLIKAYEVSTGDVISEEQKQVANEEMVKTAQLADTLGKDETNALMTNIKEELANNYPDTEQAMKDLIQGEAEQLGIPVTETQVNSLVDLFMKMKDLDIDWNSVGQQLDVAKEKFTNFIESEEAQGFLANIKSFFTSLIDVIKGWFEKTEPVTESIIEPTPEAVTEEPPESTLDPIAEDPIVEEPSEPSAEEPTTEAPVETVIEPVADPTTDPISEQTIEEETAEATTDEKE